MDPDFEIKYVAATDEVSRVERVPSEPPPLPPRQVSSCGIGLHDTAVIGVRKANLFLPRLVLILHLIVEFFMFVIIHIGVVTLMS